MPAPPAYFDTSAVLKRYVAEVGSDAVEPLLRRHPLVSSALLVVEITSALHRRRGEFAAAVLEATWKRFSDDRGHWRLAAVSGAVLDRAEEVVRSSGVRTLDAIHVATAVLVAWELGSPLAFVTADGVQAAAAREAGMSVVVV
jgi:predicted nucleic acid-binding protein